MFFIHTLYKWVLKEVDVYKFIWIIVKQALLGTKGLIGTSKVDGIDTSKIDIL